MTRVVDCIVVFLISSCLTWSCWALSPEELGVDMAANAYEAVCWYEYLKQFPKADVPAFSKCYGKAQRFKEQLQHQPFFKSKPKEMLSEFANGLSGQVLSRLPKDYKSSCEKYLKNVKSAPAADESDGLNDKKKDYPLKAFSYCLLNTLRKSHGEKAIEAVKKERTHSKKEWMQTLLDRENEARARHSVEPLKILEELNQSAQKWVEVNAKDCRMYHSRIEDRMYTGNVTIENLGNLVGYTGENLMSGSTNTEKDVAAYVSADFWYDEIKLYPYPEGFKGQGSDPLFPRIGHFTQMVWKDTKYVGYGYGNNPKCKGGMGMFVVAHYYPIGNIIGEFTDNVNSPKDA